MKQIGKFYNKNQKKNLVVKEKGNSKKNLMINAFGANDMIQENVEQGNLDYSIISVLFYQV